MAGPPALGTTGHACTATSVGTVGHDELHGTNGPDVIVGRSGSDDIEARGGSDVVCGNLGNDVCIAEERESC